MSYCVSRSIYLQLSTQQKTLFIEELCHINHLGLIFIPVVQEGKTKLHFHARFFIAHAEGNLVECEIYYLRVVRTINEWTKPRRMGFFVCLQPRIPPGYWRWPEVGTWHRTSIRRASPTIRVSFLAQKLGDEAKQQGAGEQNCVWHMISTSNLLKFM